MSSQPLLGAGQRYQCPGGPHQYQDVGAAMPRPPGQLTPDDVVVDVRVIFAELSYIQADEFYAVGPQPLSTKSARYPTP